MPATNQTRRDLLADAAITLLARDGARGLTHRAVEREAGVPTGTASNYFPTADLLFAAAAQRIGQLHARAMDDIADAEASSRRTGEAKLAELLAASLADAVTHHRDRYLAIFELQNESLRRPQLEADLQAMQRSLATLTHAHHQRVGLNIDPRRVPILMHLYGAVLHSLLLQKAGTVDRPTVDQLVQAIVRGTRQN